MNIETSLERAGYETIRGWLEQRCAIHYPEHKRDLLQQRLSRVQRAFHLAALSQLAAEVTTANNHEVQMAVIHAASTNHTYFFRETDVLEHFRSNVLPVLKNRREIRLWSAACSTGDEVYTLAILIAETLGMEALARTQILGTDISGPVIERAEAGIFPARHLEQTPDHIRSRYLRPVGIEQFQVTPEIRAACTFRRMNLKSYPYPFRKPFQAVFCRNVLYYFAMKDQIDVIEAIADVTEPDGILFTSVTETMRDMSPRWTYVTSGINRRTGAGA
ncbi:CheR family methyltransferase [Paracoccus sp. T5]|uniref:CheR family methyltransferase n=1 Tax=Paracoccus sp. T5 TaxID=3402161 RepID=UPI003AE3B303